jgi:hypothetical protein
MDSRSTKIDVGQYILKGREPVRVYDVLVWAKWFEKAPRHVGRTEIRPGVVVSTVFLGIDHSFGFGPPLLFETMVFRDDHGDEEERCSTWEQAEEQHKCVCERVAGEIRDAEGR